MDMTKSNELYQKADSMRYAIGSFASGDRTAIKTEDELKSYVEYVCGEIVKLLSEGTVDG